MGVPRPVDGDSRVRISTCMAYSLEHNPYPTVHRGEAAAAAARAAFLASLVLRDALAAPGGALALGCADALTFRSRWGAAGWMGPPGLGVDG